MFWPWRRATTVWQDGFKEGFKKAFDMMTPIYSEQLGRAKDVIEEVAVTTALKRLGHGNKKAD